MNLDKLREVCGVLTRARRQLDSADQPWITENVVKQLDSGILIIGGLIAAEHGQPCQAEPKAVDFIKLGVAERLTIGLLRAGEINASKALEMAERLIKGCS